MNPFGLIIIGLGLVMIVIGFKGTQHQILSDLSGHSATPTGTAAAQNTGTGNTSSSGSSGNGSEQAV